MAQWSLHSQHSHFSNKTLPLANVLCCLHTKISAQAFCSSYCFVICCTIRKHLALGMVPFSRKNNTKNISRTQKANQAHTYTQNNNNNNDKPTTPPPKKPNPKTNKTKMPYNLAKTQTKPKKNTPPPETQPKYLYTIRGREQNMKHHQNRDVSGLLTNITAIYGWTDDFLGLYSLKRLTSSPYQSKKKKSPGNVLLVFYITWKILCFKGQKALILNWRIIHSNHISKKGKESSKQQSQKFPL